MKGKMEVPEESLEIMKRELVKIAAATEGLLKGPIDPQIVFKIIAWKSGCKPKDVKKIMTTAAHIDQIVLKKTAN